jgi:hypothetical protein
MPSATQAPPGIGNDRRRSRAARSLTTMINYLDCQIPFQTEPIPNKMSNWTNMKRGGVNSALSLQSPIHTHL